MDYIYSLYKLTYAAYTITRVANQTCAIKGSISIGTQRICMTVIYVICTFISIYKVS